MVKLLAPAFVFESQYLAQRADNLVLLSLLLAVIFFYWDARQPAASPTGADRPSWSLAALLVASFLTLFGELAFIRWIAVEVRIFAYVKNLALLVCFLGFGIGCALAKRRPRWALSAFAILAQVFFIKLPVLRGYLPLEQISQWLGANGDVEIWQTGSIASSWHFALAVMSCFFLFVLLALVFIPVGQAVSSQLDSARTPLYGYSWNLLGSLLGILAFFFVCRQMFRPIVWFSIIFLAIVLLEKRWRQKIAILCCGLPCAIALHEDSEHIFWTPYQQIQMTDLVASDGHWLSTTLFVNHVGYQNIVDLRPEFLARYPGLLREDIRDTPYNVAYRFVKPAPRVLVVGAGSGNDVAAALRNGANEVDAVEIDPAILAIGRRRHPEHPYDSPKVHVHLTDARAFLRQTNAKYDLVMFGLLDSHTQFSDYSNMRIDNFVYTEESLRQAKDRLAPDGVLFVKFAVDKPWMGQRIFKLIATVFGKPPIAFVDPSFYTSSAHCFVVSSSSTVESAIAGDEGLRRLLTNRPDYLDLPQQSVPITTDDWPYLYQEGRFIPRTYYSVALIVIVMALGFYVCIPDARRKAPSLFFFAMGAGFLLLETQVISRLALFFGTTWQVNGIVIGALLTTLLLANVVAGRWRNANEKILFAGLLCGLLIAYFTPFGRIALSSSVVGIFAAIVFSIPVFFAGLLFASEFRRTPSPSASLGANILGAVVGGLLENLSFVFGMRALLLVAALVYAVAFLALWRSEGRRHLVTMES